MADLNGWLRRRAWSWLTGGAMMGPMQIGLGGRGHNPDIPECPICFAYGGGGHGGLCPNGNGAPSWQWTREVPEGRTRPKRPTGWHTATGTS